MPVEIRETTITPAQDGIVVQLHISDAPPDDESVGIALQLTAKLPKSQNPLLAKVQRDAMKVAQEALSHLLRALADDARQGDYS